MQKIILSKAWPNSRNISTQPSATLLPEKCCMRLFWFSFKSIAGGCCGIKLKKLPNLAWNFCTWACAVYSFVCCSQSYSHSLYLRLLTLNTAQYLQMKFLRFALTQILPNFICLAFSFNISESGAAFISAARPSSLRILQGSKGTRNQSERLPYWHFITKFSRRNLYSQVSAYL